MSTVPLNPLMGQPVIPSSRKTEPKTLAQKVRAKYPGVYDDMDDVDLDQKIRSKFPGVYDDVPDSGKGIVDSFLGKGVDMLSGMAQRVAPAAKAAFGSPKDKADFAIDTVKGLYQGAVDSGADAIARQLPAGAEEMTGEEVVRGGLAAVPLVGSYVMNTVSDLEEGKWRQVVGEKGFDALAMAAAAKSPAIIRPLKKIGGKVVEGLPVVKAVAKEMAKDYVPGVRQYQKVAKAVEEAKKALPAKPPASDPATIQKGLAEYRARIAAEEAKRKAAKVIRPDPPVKATETPSEPIKKTAQEKVAEAKSKLRKPDSDVVEAKPAFPGQQGAKGATKARFADVAERNAKSWLKDSSPEVVVKKLKTAFKMTDGEAIALVERLK
jgi:hypothetical protein